jgi:hypothetical protein
MTTTKRGVDGNSELYLRVKDKMRDGLKLFTNFTNKWKADLDTSKGLKEAVGSLTFDEVLERTRPYSKSAANFPNATIYQPALPIPQTAVTHRWIRYRKPIGEVDAVARHFFDTVNVKPSDVGEEAFNFALTEAAGE